MLGLQASKSLRPAFADSGRDRKDASPSTDISLFLRKKISTEHSGWRSLMDVMNSMRVLKSNLYGDSRSGQAAQRVGQAKPRESTLVSKTEVREAELLKSVLFPKVSRTKNGKRTDSVLTETTYDQYYQEVLELAHFRDES